jgi:hypothetical protein
MSATTQHLSHAPPLSPPSSPVAAGQHSTGSELPTWAQRLGETAPLLSAPAFFGPPLISLLGPWLLLVLVLIGPFALILMTLVVIAAAAGVLAALLYVIAAPFLLVRHFHVLGAVGATGRPSPPPLRTRVASSGPLGQPQTKGLS